jgi:hypothetical protein
MPAPSPFKGAMGPPNPPKTPNPAIDPFGYAQNPKVGPPEPHQIPGYPYVPDVGRQATVDETKPVVAPDFGKLTVPEHMPELSGPAANLFWEQQPIAANGELDRKFQQKYLALTPSEQMHIMVATATQEGTPEGGGRVLQHLMSKTPVEQAHIIGGILSVFRPTRRS